MDYEIIGATTEPDEQGMLRVDDRTSDGKESWIRYSAGDRTMDELKQHYRDFAKSRGYLVDADMRPYKPAPA